MAGRSADISAVKNKPNRRRRCWLVAGLLGIGIGAILAVRAHLQNERVQALVREIEAKGGKVAVGPSVIDEIRGWWQEVIYPYEGGGATVLLFDTQLDTAWLRDRDYLADLSIIALVVDDSPLDANDVVRLIDQHPLRDFSAHSLQDADSVAIALARKSLLTKLELERSDLTDDGLRLLPLEQLETLHVNGTHVTPAGLNELRRCCNLETLIIDGTQFDETVVAALTELPALQDVDLIGEDINDENIHLIAALQHLQSLYLDETSVTDSKIEDLRQSMPGTVIVDSGSAE